MFVKFHVLVCLLTGLLSCSEYKSRWLDKPILKVNDIEMNASEFSERLALKLRNYDALTVKDLGLFNRAKEETVDEFILEALTIKWLQQKGLQLKDSQVKDELLKLKKAYPDELTFKRALAMEGLTFNHWLKKLRTTLSQQIIIDELTKELSEPSQEELKAYYRNHLADFKKNEQFKLRQIVLTSENNANRVLSELKKGRNFSELAKKFSITPEAKNDGLIGWVEKGIVEVFDEALKSGKGLNNKIFKSSFGFHIIEVIEIKKGYVIDFESAKSQVVSKLMSDKKQKAFANWLENEIRSSRVYKDEALISSIYIETKG